MILQRERIAGLGAVSTIGGDPAMLLENLGCCLGCTDRINRSKPRCHLSELVRGVLVLFFIFCTLFPVVMLHLIEGGPKFVFYSIHS